MKLLAQTAKTVAIVTTAVLTWSTSARAATLTIGQNFTGSTYLVDSSFSPPDTMGAVGTDYIVELINGRYSVYRKSDGTRVDSSTLNDFWSKAGVTPTGPSAFDPRVVYDSSSERWFAASVDNAESDNNFLLAVSKSSDPTTGWTGFAIDSDSTNQRWADFPTLGFDKDGVYLSATMFPIAGRGVFDRKTTIAAVPKNNLLAGITVPEKPQFENVSLSETGFTVQPIVDLDDTGLPIPLLSAYNTPTGVLKRSNITGSITSPTLDTSDGFISVTPFGSPSDAEQPGSKQNLDTNDNRFSGNVVLKNGIIWGVQTVNSGDRAAQRWVKIDENTNALLQEGLIADPNLDFYYGSIAINDFNDVVIGVSGSSESQFVSSYAVLGETVAGVTTFGTPVLLKAGVDDYQRLVNRRNRWGDYSATVVDPTDPLRFWTFQEWVAQEDIWATQITELKVTRVVAVPEPASGMGLAFGALALGFLLNGKNKRKAVISRLN